MPSRSKALEVRARWSSPSRTRCASISSRSQASCARGSNGSSASQASTRSCAYTLVRLVRAAARTRRELARDRHAEPSKRAPARFEPAGELRRRLDLEALEQAAAKVSGRGGELIVAGCSEPGPSEPFDLGGVEERVREVERYLGVAAGEHARAAARVDQRAQLAEAPAQLAARIMGAIP
jgi:hypothetical protein